MSDPVKERPRVGRRGACRVVAIGQLPPPVTGFSHITAQVIGSLGECFDLTSVNLSAGAGARGLSYHLRRVSKCLWAGWVLVRRSFGRKRIAYLACEGDAGLLYSSFLILVARIFQYRIYLHHHSFGYINEKRWLMAILLSIGGTRVHHIFLCPHMRSRFKSTYGKVELAITLSNAAFVPTINHTAISGSASEPLRLGLLSNLNKEKGLHTFIELVRRLRQQSVNVTGVLAGPIALEEDRALVRDAEMSLGSALKYCGPLYGDDKIAFYNSIDVFVFPTTYANEAQPTVLFEALAHGVLVISNARGCVASQVGSDGLVLRPSDDFFHASSVYILDLLRDRGQLLQLRTNAARNYLQKQKRAFDELTGLCRSMDRAHLAPVAVIGPYPPPITGQSMYMPFLEESLAELEFISFKLLTRSHDARLQQYVLKIGRAIKQLFLLLISSRPRAAVVILDSGLGLLINICFVAVLRLKGTSRIFLSHHSFAYVDRKSELMTVVCRLAGGNALHGLLCSTMKNRFAAQYGNDIKSLVLSNARRTVMSVPPRPPYDDVFVIGYLSNISFEKGIAEYLDIVSTLRSSGRNIRALVAGPAVSEEVNDLLVKSVRESSGAIEWIGSIRKKEKTAFFGRCSVLLFPTNYVNEAQPNVVFEALAAGCPVITSTKGCCADDVTSSGSAAFPHKDFVPKALESIGLLIDAHNRREYEPIRAASRVRFEECLKASLSAESALVSYLNAEPESPP